MLGRNAVFLSEHGLTIADKPPNALQMFNTTYGAYDCPPTAPPGIIDVRNNIFAMAAQTAGASPATLKFAYCQSQNFTFGKNWVSPGWTSGTTGTVVGAANLVVPSVNNPKFVNLAAAISTC